MKQNKSFYNILSSTFIYLCTYQTSKIDGEWKNIWIKKIQLSYNVKPHVNLNQKLIKKQYDKGVYIEMRFYFFCIECHYCSIAKMIGNDFLTRHDSRDGCIDRPGAGRPPDGFARIILRYFLRKRGLASAGGPPGEGRQGRAVAGESALSGRVAAIRSFRICLWSKKGWRSIRNQIRGRIDPVGKPSPYPL